MAVHFHQLVVNNIERETRDCVIIHFKIPGNLKEIFQYTQGQNITLKMLIGGEELRRTYSICSASFENNLCVAVKKVINGKFSTHINDYLQIGDIIEVLPPTGQFFTTLQIFNKKNYLAIAAGSGITPIISIIKTTLATEPSSSFTLIYGNQSRDSIIFFETLSNLKNKYFNRFNLINILSREKTEIAINYGRIELEKLIQLQKLVDFKKMDETFICGPQEMIFTSKSYLKSLGIEDKNIHFELFSTSGLDRSITKKLAVTEKSNAKSNVTIQLDGRSFDFDLAYDNDSILDAALKTGIDLPYACKGGVCCTCRAKLIKGEVIMDVNYALEADEIAKGFILTCQSHPTTEYVVIDFDSR